MLAPHSNSSLSLFARRPHALKASCPRAAPAHRTTSCPPLAHTLSRLSSLARSRNEHSCPALLLCVVVARVLADTLVHPLARVLSAHTCSPLSLARCASPARAALSLPLCSSPLLCAHTHGRVCVCCSCSLFNSFSPNHSNSWLFRAIGWIGIILFFLTYSI